MVKCRFGNHHETMCHSTAGCSLSFSLWILCCCTSTAVPLESRCNSPHVFTCFIFTWLSFHRSSDFYLRMMLAIHQLWDLATSQVCNQNTASSASVARSRNAVCSSKGVLAERLWPQCKPLTLQFVYF